jgi:hypothetical protein
MKTLAVILCLTSTTAFAQRVVLRNPTVEGKPIFAHQAGDLNSEVVRDAMAHTVCRLAGYTHAVFESETRYKTVSKVHYLTQPGAVVDPQSVQARGMTVGRLGFASPRYNSTMESGLNPNARLRFETIRSVDACAEIAQCRQFDPTEFRLSVSEFSHNIHHPFIRQCLNWARSAQPLVFSEVTCESADHLTTVAQNVEDFHARTRDSFRVETSARPHALTQVRNPEVTCNSRAALGSLVRQEIMSCDYDFIPSAS